MTDSKTYDVLGADVIITVATYPEQINVHITVDTSKLDVDLPDHSAHCLMDYLAGSLAHYTTGQSYWWCKTQRTIRVRTGSQAHRVIKHALAKIDDAIHQALLTRKSRMDEGAAVLAE